MGGSGGYDLGDAGLVRFIESFSSGMDIICNQGIGSDPFPFIRKTAKK